MESLNKKSEFSNKLLIVLRKITESQFKNLDNIYLEKLLTNFRYEYDFARQYLNFPEVLQWLLDTLLLWKTQNLSVSVAGFTFQFIGILCKYEEDFNMILENSLTELPDVLKSDNMNNISLRISYLKLLSDIASHKSGCKWILSSKQWKTALNLCYSNFNFYVEKEGLLFLKKLVIEVKSEDNVLSEIFEEILFFISQKEKILNESNEDFSKIRLSFRLLKEILKAFIISNDSTIIKKFFKNFDAENFYKFVFGNNVNENLLEEISTFYILFLILQYDKQYLLSMKGTPENLLNVFKILLEQGHSDTIIKLSKFCHILWSEMKNDVNHDSTTAVNFILFQLIYVLIYIKNPPNSKAFDFYVQKLFDLTDDKSRKFLYSVKDNIKNKSSSREWALKGLLSITRNFSYINNDEAVLIFQALVYVLKVFVPKACEADSLESGSEKLDEKLKLCIADASLLSAILNALCSLVDKFKINWSESLESLCLLKIACKLLENKYLSAHLAVQTLLLMKLAISNFMSPNLALLLNNAEDSGFECPMSLLYKRLEDSNWEIRDSCIEVLTTIIELAETKYPAFQQLLIEENFCASMFSLIELDSESYVRASALRALTAMTRIDNIRPRINNPDFLGQITTLVKSESEGIVRREAVMLLTQMYLSMNEESDLFYEIMGYLAVYDLHWEVKVNALLFWEKVIDKVLSDQGMIDGFFPNITFSKEHKKIVNLTSEEIKLRLKKVLEKLSEIGCLHVLLSTLYDDCDFQVIQKSVQILSDFLNNLKRYGVVNKFYDNYSTSIPPKRKCMTHPIMFEQTNSPREMSCDDLSLNKCEPENSNSFPDSDAIIEEIVSEMDINLLINVCTPLETKTNLKKTILLKKIKPESFLQKMQDFDFEKFLNEKRKFFVHTENDLKSLVDDIILMNSVSKNNVMDCY